MPKYMKDPEINEVEALKARFIAALEIVPSHQRIWMVSAAREAEVQKILRHQSDLVRFRAGLEPPLAFAGKEAVLLEDRIAEAVAAIVSAERRLDVLDALTAVLKHHEVTRFAKDFAASFGNKG